MIHLYSGNKSSLRTTTLMEKVLKGGNNAFHNDFRNLFRGGHAAVRESLILGLQLLEEDFQINAQAPGRSGTKVGVLAGSKIARDLLRNGSKLILGPNYAVSPRQDPEVFADVNTVSVVVPSEWVGKLYQSELAEISEKIRVWPAGIDTDFWRKPQVTNTKKKAIIYVKRQDPEEVTKTVDILGSAGFECEVVVYGSYTLSNYRRSLEDASFVVWLGSSESQGLAQFEAWSMGVPTFVRWSESCLTIPLGKDLGQVVLSPGHWSPSPYLNGLTGMFWKNWEQLLDICSSYEDGGLVFNPRKFVLANYSVRTAASNYLSMF